MTTKADFTEDEWKTVLEAPPAAGLMVAAAQRGGSFRESFGIAKAYTEARKQHGESALLDEIAATKPAMDHTRHHSLDELRAATSSTSRMRWRVLDDQGQRRMRCSSTRSSWCRWQSESLPPTARASWGLSGERVSDAETAAINEIKTTLELPVDAA